MSNKECLLGDVLEFGNGKTKPNTNGNIPIYGGNGILGYSSESNYDNETIVIGRVGAYCGTVHYTDHPIWVSDNALAAKPKQGNDAKYLYYFLKNFNLNQYAAGSSHPLVTQTILNSLEVTLPESEKEQKAIASVLSSLDDKIDLLHRQNQTQEAIAEALYRQWFVEEAEENWELGKLNDVLSVKGGTTPSTKKPEFWDGNINWCTPKDLSLNNQMYLLDTGRKITDKGLKQISSGLLPKGTLLMSSRAPVGYLAFAEMPVAVNQGFIAILANKGFSKYFMYLWLKSNMDYVRNNANGSTFMEISKTAFKSLDIIKPPYNKREKFDKTIKPIFKKINNNIYQINTLQNMRDSLLPQLMSGKVRIQS